MQGILLVVDNHPSISIILVIMNMTLKKSSGQRELNLCSPAVYTFPGFHFASSEQESHSYQSKIHQTSRHILETRKKHKAQFNQMFMNAVTLYASCSIGISWHFPCPSPVHEFKIKVLRTIWKEHVLPEAERASLHFRPCHQSKTTYYCDCLFKSVYLRFTGTSLTGRICSANLILLSITGEN